MPGPIAIVAPNLLYGEPNPRSIRARRLAAGLSERGFEVEVLAWWSGAEPQEARPDWLGGARLRAIAAPSPFVDWKPAAEGDGGGGSGTSAAAVAPDAATTEGATLQPWTEAVLAELTALPAAERPALIYAIGVPVAALVAGEQLARALELPLIVDLGDPWPAPDEASRRERTRTLTAAEAVITTTEALAAQIRPELQAGCEVSLIPNGGELRRRPPGPAPNPPLFVHLGAINAGRADPIPAFTALAALHRSGRIELRSHTTGFHPEIDRLPHPHLPLLGHKQAIELTARASAALVLGNREPAQLPSKSFEIACTETWALCVAAVEPDPAATLLERSGHAVVAAGNSTEAITAAAGMILEREAAGNRPEPVAAYAWPARIEQVAAVIVAQLA